MSTGDLEFVGKINAKKLTSLEEDAKKEQAQIREDQERWANMALIAQGRQRSANAKSWRRWAVNDSLGKSKPTLESLLKDQQLITGKKLIERDRLAKEAADKQRALLEEAIEFEQRNRRIPRNT